MPLNGTVLSESPEAIDSVTKIKNSGKSRNERILWLSRTQNNKFNTIGVWENIQKLRR